MSIGANNSGTIFRLSSDGTKPSTLYSFGRRTGQAYSPMMQATDGNFYATTGLPEIGKVYKFSMGLPPFVKTLPTTGLVGTPVTILGNNLTGASNVTFNGTPALFTVLSATAVSTTVPPGASTGKVGVITPTAKLMSEPGPFRVRPVLSNFTPASGPAGTVIVITGDSLTTVSQVNFTGNIPAPSFTVISDHRIMATVPAGAQSGPIQVTTRGGTATSTAIFTARSFCRRHCAEDASAPSPESATVVPTSRVIGRKKQIQIFRW